MFARAWPEVLRLTDPKIQRVQNNMHRIGQICTVCTKLAKAIQSHTSPTSQSLQTLSSSSSTVPIPGCADDFIRELAGCRVLVQHNAAIARQVPRTVHHTHKATQNRNHRALLPNFPVAYRWPCSGPTQVASHIDQLYWKALAASTCRILHGKDFMDFDQDETADIVLEMYQNY